MSTYDDVNVTVADGIATVELDAASGQNALTVGMADELIEIAAELEADPAARCIVLTHAGEFMCAGADLSSFDRDERDAPRLRKLAGRIHEAVIQFHQAEIPVVGGIDGIAAGAGFSLSIMPDVVLLSEDARLEYAYPRIGLTGDGGSTFFLPRLVGLRTAREILLLDEPIDPESAVEMGLATEAVPADEFDDRLDELASRLASGPTQSLGAAKRLMTESFERGLADQLAAETDAIAEAAKTEDYERGIEAFFGDGEPEFTGQ